MRLFSGWLLRGGSGELEVLRLRVVRANRDRRGLRSQLLVPGADRIGSRVETRNRELSVLSGYREERMREHGDVGLHPRVHVALDLEEVLRLAERRARFLHVCRHRPVESTVDFGKGVNVVKDAVRVEDLVG